MFVKSMNEAWCAAKKIFPTDYRLDEMASKNAGYEIYYSTAEGNNEWISNLGTALELNMKSGTLRINVVEDKPATMTATVRSVHKAYEDYKVFNVFHVMYVKGEIILMTFEGDGTSARTFNSNDVIVEVTP